MHLVRFENKTNLNDLDLDKVGPSTSTRVSASNNFSSYRSHNITKHYDVSINIVYVMFITLILMYYR